MAIRIKFFILSMLIYGGMVAQSSNINCATAFEIPNATSWCSAPNEFDNENAGGSEYLDPDCFDGAENDLWFSFTATKLAANIIVDGEENGDLSDPQIIIYLGDDCDDMLVDFGICDVVTSGPDIAQIFIPSLVIGQKYYVRVAARNTRQGTFQFCIESYNPPVEPGQDCPTASVLCSKEKIVVQSVTGAGDDPDEAANSCLDVSGNSESQSTWFSWTAGTSGTLTFDIIPLVFTDDLDFALYRLPNGVNDCSGKELLRCNATNGSDSDCGPNTGLNLTSTDVSEDLNCDAGEDGYVQFIDMVAGQSYALVINNFSNSEAGFSLEFGGSGEFLQPDPDVIDYGVRINNDCEIEYFIEVGSGEYEFDFGPGVDPQQVSGDGLLTFLPANLFERTVLVTHISDLGCKVTEEVTYEATCFFELEDENNQPVNVNLTNVVEPDCGVANGSFEVMITPDCSNSLILEYSLNGGPYTFENSFNNLTNGDYEIEIRIADDPICVNTQNITLNSDIGLTANINIVAVDDPDCRKLYEITGSLSGAIDGSEVIEWSFGNGVTPQSASGPGSHTVEYSEFGSQEVVLNISRGIDCSTSFTEVLVVEPCQRSQGFEIGNTEIMSANCNDEGGVILVEATGGCGGYQYNLNAGPYQDEGIFTNLTSGRYGVGLMDADGCEIILEVQVDRLDDIFIDAGADVTVNVPGDTIQLDVQTSVNPEDVTITWSPTSSLFCEDQTLTCLDPFIIVNGSETYTIIIIDSTGCEAFDQINVVLDFDPLNFIFRPNVFSPNDDGINDVFTIFGDPRYIENINIFSVFDRWGNKIYEGRNLNPTDGTEGWDGRFNNSLAEIGVYSWFAEVKLSGSLATEPVIISGDVTLIR